MSLRGLVAMAVIAMTVLATWAWVRTHQPAEPMSARTPTTDAPAASPQVVVESGGDPGITWKVPTRWTEAPSNPMRLATYAIPPARGDRDEARCAVYYFGPGQGGDPETNVERWIREFEAPVKPERLSRTIDGLAVSTVRVRGTYLAHAGMGDEEDAARPHHELYAAIVEGPDGALFFKFVGPEETVDAAAAEFEGMLGTLRKKTAP
jgi:hypothetical protein